MPHDRVVSAPSKVRYQIVCLDLRAEYTTLHTYIPLSGPVCMDL